MFSSGFFGKASPPEQALKDGIGEPETRKGLKLLWFATGSDDGLLEQTRSTVDLFKTSGNNPVFRETSGGHTWINWRLYLRDFTQLLFR